MHSRVQAALAAPGVSYIVHHHADYSEPIHNPADFARVLGYPIERITKALFVGDGERYAVVLCPIPKKVNLKRVATLLDARRISLAAPAILAERLGFPPHGVSPLGAAPYPVLMDQSVFDHPTVLVGAGQVGVEVEMAPAAIQKISQGRVAELGNPPG